mmetsp:Transcript_57234/g.90991  ORF Transcript_57234/g.90991 Transcript_57234/m.90991 type:complete len:232 (+) Transcript_57234:39-734(+)
MAHSPQRFPSQPSPSSSSQCSPIAKLAKPSKQPRPFPHFSQTQFYSKPFDLAYEELAKARKLRRLEILFFEADADGSGEMSLDEFRDALRMPRIQQAFAALGIQPHQSQLVFKSLDKRKSGELSITEFMTGLTELVGNDADGTGKELDIECLRPSYKAKKKQAVSLSSKVFARSASAPKLIGKDQGSGMTLGPVHLLPKVQVQRAFVHSASAQALHSAAASRHPLKLIFPF